MPVTGQAVAEPEPLGHAEHEVDVVALRVEDPVDRGGRQQLHAVDGAAVGDRRLHLRDRAGVAVAVGRTDVGLAPLGGPRDARPRAPDPVKVRTIGLVRSSVARSIGSGGGGTTGRDAVELGGRQADVEVGADRTGDLRREELAELRAR
jgi:hypothetical protein